MKLALILLAALVAMANADNNNAALIVGGYWYYDDGDPIKDKAEVFCDGQSVAVEDFPMPAYLAGGVLFQDEHDVLVCGGYGCDANNVCETKAECYWWNPTDDWRPAPSLLEKRFNFLMGSVFHIDYSGQGRLPLSLGYGYETEIYNKRDQEWQPYRQLEDRNWYSMGCLIDYNDRIYSMRDKIVELNPYDWTTDEIHELPETLIRSGKCAGLTIDGSPGIFSRYGYYYNFDAKNWTKKAAPPVEPLAGTSNVMWSFNGKPTIFGNPICNDEGDCQNKKIVQYDPAKDQWNEIGEMLQPRIYQTVIEIPYSWCEALGVEPTEPTTTPTEPTASTASTDATTSDGTATLSSSLTLAVSAVLLFLLRN